MKLKVICLGWLLLHLVVRAAAISVDSVWVNMDSQSKARLLRVAVLHRTDTTTLFRQAWMRCCRTLMEQHFVGLNSSVEGDLSPLNMGERRLRCCHLFCAVPQAATHTQLMRDKEFVALLRSSLVADEQAALSHGRDEKCRLDTCWIYPHRQPEVLEQVLDTLRPRVWSEPILTPMGIHLLKVIEQDTVPQKVQERLSDSLLERLKEKHHLKVDQELVAQLRKGKTPEQGVLFYLDGRPYTLSTYHLFIASRRISPRRGFEVFLRKSLVDAEVMTLFADVDAHGSLSSARDNLLIHHLLLNEVEPQLQDEQALEAWFQKHIAEFKQPIFRGLVLHCTDKQQGRALRKFLKRLPEAERQKALVQVFATQSEEAPIVEEGVFVHGSNPFVDAALFRERPPKPYPGRPYLQLVGRMSKGPENYHEVYQEVVDRYRQELIQQLLRAGDRGTNVEN